MYVALSVGYFSTEFEIRVSFRPSVMSDFMQLGLETLIYDPLTLQLF